MSSQDFESELINCPVCGSAQYSAWFTLTDRNIGLPGEFPLVRCTQCGVAYLNPRPSLDSVGRFYPRAYAPHQAPSKRTSGLLHWLRSYGQWKRYRVLARLRWSGRVLDVGCGIGQFMVVMEQHGWKSVGIDQSEQAVAYVRGVLGLEAYQGYFESLRLPDGAFDAITMWDSLEHMHFPRTALREAWRLLNPGGYLIIRVPSLDSFDRHLFKTNWAGFDAPRHLVAFDRQALIRLVADCGFTVERLWCLSGGFASFVISWRFTLGLLQDARDWRLNIVDNPVTQLLSFPYFFLVDRLKRGSEITVLARRMPSPLPSRSDIHG